MTTWSTTDALEAERRYTAGLSLTPRQAAHILGWCFIRGQHKGTPDRRMVIEAVHAGKLAVIDPTLDPVRWTISAETLRRFVGARPTVTDITPPLKVVA